MLLLFDLCVLFFFFFKQKTAYEMRISDWSSDVCSSDLVLRLIDERRYLRRVARDEQESLPALREAADDAAIVRVFVDAVAIAAEQRDDLIEEFSAARPDPRDILEKDDRNRAVFVGLEREPDSAPGEPVARLVFVGRPIDRKSVVEGKS